MKNWLIGAMIVFTTLFAMGCACETIEAGNVGVKVYLLGGSKGVDHEEVGVGRYFIGINERLYSFPTFTQNYTWTKNKSEGSPTDESFNFQDVQGLELNADIGITYRINPKKVSTIFEKYKKGLDEITSIYLRNMVRDALVKRTSTLDVEYIYGKGRAELIENVTKDVQEICKPIGIEIEKIYWIGRIKLPPAVKNAIDSKIKATQIAQQRENELREAEAQAKKNVAEAEGNAKSQIAKAQGEAEAITLRAKAQAEANKILAASITPELVKYKTVETWDGKLPIYTGADNSFIQLK